MRAKIRIQSLMIAAIACVALIVMPQSTKADQINDEANGVEYDNKMYCNVGIADSYHRGGSATSYIYLTNYGDTIQNVKSSSSNLIAKVTSRYYYKSKERADDYTYDNPKYKITTDYSNFRISCFAKKKGRRRPSLVEDMLYILRKPSLF